MSLSAIEWWRQITQVKRIRLSFIRWISRSSRLKRSKTDPVLRETLVDRSESFSLTRVEWGRQSTLGGLAAERSGDNMTEQTRQAASREAAEAQALSWRGFTLSLPRQNGRRRPSRGNSRLNLAFLNSPGSANAGL